MMTAQNSSIEPAINILYFLLSLTKLTQYFHSFQALKLYICNLANSLKKQ